MKKLILILILLCTFACGPIYHLSNDYNTYYSQEQVDSICVIEKLPKNLDKWSSMTMFEDSTCFKQYTYIRSNDSTQVVWTLTDLDSLYKFKRKTLKITDRK